MGRGFIRRLFFSSAGAFDTWKCLRRVLLRPFLGKDFRRSARSHPTGEGTFHHRKGMKLIKVFFKSILSSPYDTFIHYRSCQQPCSGCCLPFVILADNLFVTHCSLIAFVELTCWNIILRFRRRFRTFCAVFSLHNYLGVYATATGWVSLCTIESHICGLACAVYSRVIGLGRREAMGFLEWLWQSITGGTGDGPSRQWKRQTIVVVVRLCIFLICRSQRNRMTKQLIFGCLSWSKHTKKVKKFFELFQSNAVTVRKSCDVCISHSLSILW